ncbi:MAG TPA: hypothetical protein VIF62_34385 [Labilithrix sp.]
MRKLVALVPAAFACTLLAIGSGCTSGPGTVGPGGKHMFEGNLEWRGVEGAPPGTAWGMQCTMRGEDFVCDVQSRMNDVQLGFRGPGSTLCFRLRGQPMWIPISLQTIGIIFSFLPEELRRDSVHQTQGQYRFTGQVQNVRGQSCRVVEIHEDDGCVETVCYSDREYFAGDQKAVPILHQMGFDPGFITTLAENGIGWKLVELDRSGQPKLAAEATRIEPKTIDPATFAGVCGIP